VSDEDASEVRFLFGGSRKTWSGQRFVTEPRPASREVARPFRDMHRESLAPTWVRRHLPALVPHGDGLQGLRVPASRALLSKHPGTSRGLELLFRGTQRRAPHIEHGHPSPHGVRRDGASAAPPMRFLPLQRLPAQSSGIDGRGCLARPPAPPGFLNLLAPSSAPCLLALFHARSAHGVRPSELCSSRTAVRRCPASFPS
jgi:hypothetical protein